MDVEMDGTGYSGHTPLKRYNSAPYINMPGSELRTNCESPTSSMENSSRSGDNNSGLGIQITERMSRRFSTSSVLMLHSPTSIAKAPSRIDQIRLEESVAQRDREAAHEREIQSKMIMSQNWDDLSLDDPDPDAMVTEARRPRSFTEPLHIITSTAGSLSPTRVGKQCFSPSLQQSIRTSSFTPSPSPSPTRKTYVRRSLSPIVLRPSPLSAVKRRIEADSVDLAENYFSTPKRYCFSNSPTACSSSTDIYQLRVSSSSTSGSNSTDEAVGCDDSETVNSQHASNLDINSRNSSLAPIRSNANGHQTMILSSFLFRRITPDTSESSSVESSDIVDSRQSRFVMNMSKSQIGVRESGERMVHSSDLMDLTHLIQSESELNTQDSKEVTVDSNDMINSEQLLLDSCNEMDSRQSNLVAESSLDDQASEICDI